MGFGSFKISFLFMLFDVFTNLSLLDQFERVYVVSFVKIWVFTCSFLLSLAGRLLRIGISHNFWASCCRYSKFLKRPLKNRIFPLSFSFPVLLVRLQSPTNTKLVMSVLVWYFNCNLSMFHKLYCNRYGNVAFLMIVNLIPQIAITE